MHDRLILASQADAVRIALLGETSSWSPDADPVHDGTTASWRTPFGLRVGVSHDPLLELPILELAAVDEPAKAEAAELAAHLPRVVSVVRFADASEMFAQAGSAERRAAALPLLAATLSDSDPSSRARVLSATVAAVGSHDTRERAGGVLASAYLGDETLTARVRLLARNDSDLRIRALARQVLGPADGLAQTSWVRRVTFIAERVADDFVPFATKLGWRLLEHQPVTEKELGLFLWQADAAVRVVLVCDIRLERDYLVVNGTSRSAVAAVDQIEQLVRAHFPCVHLDEVLDMLSEATGAADRLVLLRVAAAAAPVSYHPRMFSALADLWRDPVTALRGFAVGASVYYPWPEIVPLLDWSASYDPDLTVRSLADVALDTMRRANGAGLREIAPDQAAHRPGSHDHAR